MTLAHGIFSYTLLCMHVNIKNNTTYDTWGQCIAEQASLSSSEKREQFKIQGVKAMVLVHCSPSCCSACAVICQLLNYIF